MVDNNIDEYKIKKQRGQDGQLLVNKCVGLANQHELDFVLNVNKFPEMAFTVLGLRPEIGSDGVYRRLEGSTVLWGEVGNYDPGLKNAAHSYFSDIRKKCIPGADR